MVCRAVSTVSASGSEEVIGGLGIKGEGSDVDACVVVSSGLDAVFGDEDSLAVERRPDLDFGVSSTRVPQSVDIRGVERAGSLWRGSAFCC